MRAGAWAVQAIDACMPAAPTAQAMHRALPAASPEHVDVTVPSGEGLRRVGGAGALVVATIGPVGP